MAGDFRRYFMHTSKFCMLAISFYFENYVIISCKLTFTSRFTRIKIQIMSFLGFQKAELGCKYAEGRTGLS